MQKPGKITLYAVALGACMILIVGGLAGCGSPKSSSNKTGPAASQVATTSVEPGTKGSSAKDAGPTDTSGQKSTHTAPNSSSEAERAAASKVAAEKKALAARKAAEARKAANRKRNSNSNSRQKGN
ncbi:MAG: hypothetical protein FWF45_06060 [Coriobacteriia bacterium]|nr:hypothetical protein [Coriobacteriia bacterium]